MQRLNIAHVTATFLPHHTGTGTVAFHNAHELVQRGHTVTVFTSHSVNGDAAPSSETMQGINVYRLHPAIRYGNAVLLPSLALLTRSFDIVHLHMPFYGGSEAVLAMHLATNTPLVITHHQDVHLPGVLHIISRSHDALIGQMLMRRADRVCFTSRDYAHASRFNSLVERQHVRFAEMPNGIDIARFTPGACRVPLRDQYALQDTFVVLFVGVLDSAHHFKGVDVLLHALVTVNDEHVHLVVVGEGNMREQYQQKARAYGIGDTVHFTGFVPDEALPDYYRMADVTVLPSTTMGEAFGLVLVESLACGTPVIASALPGVRTVVDNGNDGLLVQPGNVAALANSLQTMRSMPESQRLQMGMHGHRKVAERYAWHHVGIRLETLYADVLTERLHQSHHKVNHVIRNGKSR